MLLSPSVSLNVMSSISVLSVVKGLNAEVSEHFIQSAS